MYSTCTFCNRSLGSNDVIEHFPVGRRLAFDAEKGRLWVICRGCAGWNLTPFEERWEAIEDAERFFRATRLRVSTDNIGLARARDGTDLVRIGKPQRPELAAWRYGENFIRRRRKHLVVAGAVAVGGAVFAIGGMTAGLSVAGFLAFVNIGHVISNVPRSFRPIGRIRDDRGDLVTVRPDDLKRCTIGSDGAGGLMLTVNNAERFYRLKGEVARRAAPVLFRAVNQKGGDEHDVQNAVGRLVRAGSAEQFLADAARRGKKLTRVVSADSDDEYIEESGLLALPIAFSLAIEMALHEEQERCALEGELADLERAWREAEEVGAIADSLLLPPGVELLFETLRSGR